MEQQTRQYPVGVQDFDVIREAGGVYVDKTEYVYRMTHTLGNYYFLSRPRRFGKTLLVSTLQCYFEGRKELFEGLAIDRLEKEWKTYPVLHFDMSMGRDFDKDSLNRYLISLLEYNEQRFGIRSDKTDVNVRLRELIVNAHAQTGEKVVVLVDEYDSPLLGSVHDNDQLDGLRRVMRNFYSPLKGCSSHLHFVFLTGITKFSQLSIFSELNNIDNISMDSGYAGICGITKEELTSQMAEDISLFAIRLGVTPEEVLERLVENYDGYHFTWPSPDIFNPYSLLNAFNKKKIEAYWFGSGTPTYLIEMLRKFNVLPSEIGGKVCGAETFDAPTENLDSPWPLLYQSGYLTIKDGDREMGSYTLDIPNKEVRQGLTSSLLANYVTHPNELRNLSRDMSVLIRRDDMDGALQLMKKVLGTVPYCRDANSEGHYQQMMFLMFTLLGYFSIDVEVRTPIGRVDIVLRTQKYLYLMELKFDKSAEGAIGQINLKDYPTRFALCRLPIVKVGINFDSQTRNITDWKIVKEEKS